MDNPANPGGDHASVSPGVAPTSEAAAGRGGAWKQYVLVGAVAAVAVFWKLGATVMEDHECKLALTARAMAEEDPQPWIIRSNWDYEVPPRTPLNRWMVPVENGRPRLVKTPLPYWVSAAVMMAGGSRDWAPRLPSAICAVALALVTLAIGRRLLTPRAALAGTMMLATCVGFMKWGRDARPEMMLCLWITVAMGCLYAALEAKKLGAHVLWMLAFWVAMGLANLSKQFVPLLLAWPFVAYVIWRSSSQKSGDDRSLRLLRVFLIATGAGLAVHLAVVFVAPLRWWQHAGVEAGKGYYLTMAVALGAPMLAYLLAARPWRAVARLLPMAIPGLVLMAALFVPWMLYMAKLFPGLAEGVFSEQVTERAAGEGKWTVDTRVHLYLLSLLTMALPWLAFMPGACAVALLRRFREHRGGLVFLLLWSVGLVLLFTASAAKREHYILPMLPAFCLLMGYAAEDAIFNHKWVTVKQTRLLGGGHFLTAAAGVIVVVVLAATGKAFATRAQGWTMAALAFAAAVPMAVGGALAWRGRLRPLVPLVAGAILVFYAGYWGTIRSWDERRPIRDFAVEAARLAGPGETLYHWGDPQAKTAYYTGRVVPALQWPLERANPQAADEDSSRYGERIDRLTLAWLREDANRARWVIGYDPNEAAQAPVKGKKPPAARLVESPLATGATSRPQVHPLLIENLGYQPVLEKQDVQERRLLFTLFERKK